MAALAALLLSGCDDPAPPAEGAGAAGKQSAPAIAQGAQQPAMTAATASPATDAPATVQMLFDEVKRLNAACVAAGGGVSGSPDCDLALVHEKELETLGYCIDYPNDEMLVRCPAPDLADDEGRTPP